MNGDSPGTAAVPKGPDDDPEDTSGQDGGGGSTIDERILDPMTRRVGKVVGIGAGVAVVVALALGLAGTSGRTAAAVLMLLLGLTCAAAALLALTTALVDELRQRPVGRSRVVLGTVLFLAGAALMAMVAAVGG